MSTYFYVYPFGVSADTFPTVIPTTNPGTGAESYQGGFTTNFEQDLVTDPTALPIDRGAFNQLMYDITNNIQQYQTLGTPLWITAAQNLGTSYPYDLYARVAYDAGSGIQIWENQVSGNTNTPGPLSTTGWVLCNVSAVGVPPGTKIDFCGATPPTGYLACDGSQQLISAYPALYAAIGLLWQPNLPPSAGYFNLPLLYTRVCAGAGGAGIPTPTGTIVNVGDVGGSATHLIGYQEMPPHNHSGGTVPSNSGNPGGSSSLYGANHTQNQTFPTTLPYNPASGTQTAATIVQATAMVNMCIKY